MVTAGFGKRLVFAAAAICVLGLTLAPMAFGAEGGAEGAQAGPVGLGTGLRAAGLAIGAGIAVAAGALATGRVQAAVGASGIGALVEKPEMLVNVLILFALPETLVVFGFALAAMLFGKI